MKKLRRLEVNAAAILYYYIYSIYIIITIHKDIFLCSLACLQSNILCIQ